LIALGVAHANPAERRSGSIRKSARDAEIESPTLEASQSKGKSRQVRAADARREKTEAHKRAKKAGRRYPNLVDNMRVASKKKRKRQ
jgi:hypothetical protein